MTSRNLLILIAAASLTFRPKCSASKVVRLTEYGSSLDLTCSNSSEPELFKMDHTGWLVPLQKEEVVAISSANFEHSGNYTCLEIVKVEDGGKSSKLHWNEIFVIDYHCENIRSSGNYKCTVVHGGEDMNIVRVFKLCSASKEQTPVEVFTLTWIVEPRVYMEFVLDESHLNCIFMAEFNSAYLRIWPQLDRSRAWHSEPVVEFGAFRFPLRFVLDYSMIFMTITNVILTMALLMSMHKAKSSSPVEDIYSKIGENVQDDSRITDIGTLARTCLSQSACYENPDIDNAACL